MSYGRMIYGDEGKSEVVGDGVQTFSKRLRIYGEVFVLTILSKHLPVTDVCSFRLSCLLATTASV